MAARSLSPARVERRRTESASPVSAGAALLALSVPILFLHETYQPSFSFSLGSTEATVYLADVAVLAVGTWALVTVARARTRLSRPALVLAGLAAALLVWILVATLYGPAVTDGYRFAKHAVTTAKYWEYALLALAVPVLVRRTEEVWFLVVAFVATSTVATSVGLLQFFGVLNELEGRRPAQREPSFVGIHDFAALSGAALGVALAWIAVGSVGRTRERVLVAVAAVSGTLGVTLSGAAAGAVGVLAAAAVAAGVAAARGSLTRLRFGALAGLALTVALGTVAMRSVDFGPALRALGIDVRENRRVESDSYRQRAVLTYIGVRTFADHPAVGVGWQGTSEEAAYEPYLADARKRFPDVPAEVFPSPRHPWGIQNGYLQAAADLGIPGAILFLALFVGGLALSARAALRVAARRAPEALLPVLWLCVTMGVWLGLGLVAGIPLAALQWLAIGLAAAVAGWESVERA